jgi:acyl-CoA thioesterase
MGIENVAEKDRFAKLIGIHIIDVSAGSAKAEMEVSDHHLNGLDLVHGGAIFTLADMALAAAVNSQGIDAVAINLSITFLKSVSSGKLSAQASEISLSRSFGTYAIEVTDENGQKVASLQGTAYRLHPKK